MRIVVFDLETGGVELHQPVIQLAAIAGEVTPAGFREDDCMDAKIQFDLEGCSPEALDLNSYDAPTWKAEAIPEREALFEFIDFCRKHAHLTLTSKAGRPYRVARLGGHNVQSFDVPRLQAMGRRHGDPFLACCWWYPVDTYQGAIWHFVRTGTEPPPNYRLATLADVLGVPCAPTHDALDDVRATAAIMAALLHP